MQFNAPCCFHRCFLMQRWKDLCILKLMVSVVHFSLNPLLIYWIISDHRTYQSQIVFYLVGATRHSVVITCHINVTIDYGDQNSSDICLDFWYRIMSPVQPLLNLWFMSVGRITSNLVYGKQLSLGQYMHCLVIFGGVTVISLYHYVLIDFGNRDTSYR